MFTHQRGRNPQEQPYEPVEYTGLLQRPIRHGGNFRGSEVIDDLVVLRWNTDVGTVGLAVSLAMANHSIHWVLNTLHRRYGGEPERRFAALVIAQATWGEDMLPALHAVDLHPQGETFARYEPTFRQLADALGCDVPWWHTTLREHDTILAWKPGRTPAQIPAADISLPPAALAELAAAEPPGSPAGDVCAWLYRTLRRKAHEHAAADVNDVTETLRQANGPTGLTIAATPADLPGAADPEELTEMVRRAGWAQILGRRDTLAHRVASISQSWDGGRDWATGTVIQVDPANCPAAGEWARRLLPRPNTDAPTVLENRLLDQARRTEATALLHDPDTDLPALRITDSVRGIDRILAPAHQRLPALLPLRETILSGEAVWIRTDDGRLWLAPQSAGEGLSWGYRGAGPRHLARTLARLLDDINASNEPDATARDTGLLELVENTPRHTVTTFTRAQLQAARGRG